MIQLIYNSATDWDISEHLLRVKDKNENIFVDAVLKQYAGKVPPINTIEIETINRCNNDCSFCPVNRYKDSRKPKRMTEELFKSIISQLKDMDYQGYLSLYSNDEPLLDNRICDFVKYAKRMLPKAKHALLTNGILLDKEKFKQLTSNLDIFVIDNYNDDLEILPNIQEIVNDKCLANTDCKVRVEIRKKHQVLLNRGGTAPNRKSEMTFNSKCVLPFIQMIIRPDGKLSLCCQDALGSHTMADLSDVGVKEAWNSDKYKELRKELLKKGRHDLQMCKNCDFFGVMNYFPLAWIDDISKTLVENVWKHKNAGEKILIFGNIKNAAEIYKLLKMHGIWADNIIDNKEEILLDNSFIIFTDYYSDILSLIDKDVKYVGEKYIIFNYVSGLMDEPENILEKLEHKKTNDLITVKQAEKDGRLVIFGAGANASKLYREFAFNVVYYIDNSPSKVGRMFYNKPVYPVENVLKDDTLILISSNAYLEMTEQLLKMGIKKNRIINASNFI